MMIDRDTGILMFADTAGWEAIVAVAHGGQREPDRAYQQLLRELGVLACLPQQEFGIVPHPKGWLITIRSCDETGRVDVLIPSKADEPVTVLQDTRATSEPFNDPRMMD